MAGPLAEDSERRMSDLRIVSLLPSVTEIVVALGLGDNLVGRSHQCDFPPQVTALPVLSASRIATGGDAATVHRRVGEIIAQGLSMYVVDAERLWALAPDVILTQTQCAICAVTPGDLQSALDRWPLADRRPMTVSVEPNDLAEVWQAMLDVARTLGVAEAGQALVRTLQARLDALRRAVAGRTRPRVATLEWTAPLMAAGNWMPELIEAAGGCNVLGEQGAHSPCVDFGQLAAADPDVIVITPCGFTIEHGIDELRRLAHVPEWASLRAVREGRVYLLDGVHYFNRPGPRLVESAEIVAEILHPQVCDYGHHGTGWIAARTWLPACA